MIGRAAYTIYSILESPFFVFFRKYTHATKVSADALYSVRKFSFCKVHAAFVGNLLYRVSHKIIPYAVLLLIVVNVIMFIVHYRFSLKIGHGC